MTRPNQPQNAGTAGSSSDSSPLSESETPPAPIPNKMKFVLSNKLRKSLGNYKTPGRR